jgi:GntR family transcriptional regulator
MRVERRTTKHSELGERLRELVAQLPPGAPLPPERQLAEEWGVARMTVRQAIASLAQEGLVRTVHGRGNLRAPEPISLRIRLGSFAAELREHDLEPTTMILASGVDENPPDPVVEFLGDGTSLFKIRRLRLGDAVPLALEQTWLRADMVPDLMEELLEGSLYEYLDRRGKRPDSGEESVRAGLPSAEEVRLLETASSRPVFRLTRRSLLRGRPIEIGDAVFPADRCELWFPLDEH